VEVAEALGIVYKPGNVVAVPLLAAVERAGVIPCRRSCYMTHLPVQTWTEPSATQISLTGNGRERRTGNLK